MVQNGPTEAPVHSSFGSLSMPSPGSPSALRREILVRLRRDGAATPDQLASGIGASRTGVLQQLRALEATGFVSRQTVRHGVGRPRHLYDITAEAQELFFAFSAKNHGSAIRGISAGSAMSMIRMPVRRPPSAMK